MKVARDEKQNKKLAGFSFYQNIANLEAILWNLILSANHLCWRCDIWRWVHDEGVFLSFRSSQIVVDYCITASSKGAKNERNSLNLIQHGVLYMFGGCRTIFGFGQVWVEFRLGLGQVWVKFRSFSGRVWVDPRFWHAHCIAYAHLVPRPLFFTVVTVVVA